MKNHCFLYLFVFTFCASPVLRAQSRIMPVSSKPELFTFFDKGSSAIPSGSATNSSAVLMLDGSRYEMGDQSSRGSQGTAFIIRTFRDDEKVCVYDWSPGAGTFPQRYRTAAAGSCLSEKRCLYEFLRCR